MNERIKELAEQAKKYARDFVSECKHYGYCMEQNEYELRFEQKFAELIVQECFKAAMIEAKGHMNPNHLMSHIKSRVGLEQMKELSK